MANSASACRVKPLPIQPGKPIERPALVDDYSCAAVIVFGFIVISAFIIGLMFPTNTGCAVEILFDALALGIALVVLVERRNTKYENLMAADLEARRGAADEEATRLASMAADLLQRSRDNVQKLPKYLTDSSGWLNHAQHEYDEKAYGPFWDAVEQSAINLAEFRETVQQLTRDSASYYQMLSGRAHTFPAFAITSGTLPDPTVALNQLQSILRMGQTSFEFATIWEQRRTREVLIAGFRNLGEAMSNLRFAIQGSVEELRGTLSSNIAQLLEEQVRTREANAKHAAEHSDKLG